METLPKAGRHLLCPHGQSDLLSPKRQGQRPGDAKNPSRPRKDRAAATLLALFALNFLNKHPRAWGEQAGMCWLTVPS